MNKPLLVLAIAGFWLFAFSAADAAILNASIVNTGTNANTNVYYYATGASYLDLLGGNPELGARVCSDTAGELNGKYVTFVYRAGNISTYKIIAQEGGTGNDMVQFTGCGATWCCTSPTNLDFKDTAAYYPANVYAVVSSDSAVSSDDTYIWIPAVGGWLRGSYTSNTVQSSYVQGTGNVQVTVSGITGTLSSGSQEIYPGGIAKDVSFLVEAVCDAVPELQAFNCTASATTDPGSTATLATGVVNPPDTQTRTKYYLINGINNSFCIGPDLTVTSVGLSSGSVVPGTGVTVTGYVSNSNNVAVTQNFKLAFYRDGINFANSTEFAGLAAGASTSGAVTLDTTGFLSGGKTILAKVLDKSNLVGGTIEDCNNNNDNSSSTLTIILGYYLTVFINGVVTDNFDNPGKPYNVTVQIGDTNGGSGSGMILKVIEKNGMNLFAPQQAFTLGSTKYAAVPYSILQITANATGGASFALIPTGNKLYLSQYSYLNLSEYAGNYSLYIELYDGATKKDVSGATNYALNLSTMTPVQPGAAEENTIYVVNHKPYVQTVISLFNGVFSNAYKWLGAIP